MKVKFRVELMDEVDEFLSGLSEKARRKIIYNIRKAQVVNDSDIFKTLMTTFGNLEHFTARPTTDYLLSGTRMTRPKRLLSLLTELKRKPPKHRQRKLRKPSGS